MNPLQVCYVIKMGGKTEIPIKRIDAEKIMIILTQKNKPQFIYISGEMINTSYIVGILFKEMNYGIESRPLTKQEIDTHNKFLETFENQKLIS